MTVISQGINTRVAYVQEVSFGTTPVSPTMQAVEFTQSNLDIKKATMTDTSIVGDRMVRNVTNGNVTISGDITANFKASEWDPFLASLLTGSWSANVLKTGAAVTSFSLEEGHLDIGQYRVFTGCRVSKLAMNVPNNGYVTGQWTFQGIGTSISSSPLNATVAAVSSKPPLFASLGGTFSEGGGQTSILSDLKLTIDNGLKSEFALGNVNAIGYSASMMNITGTATAYFVDAALYNKFMNEQDSSMEFVLTDANGDSYDFLLPHIHYTSMGKQISGTGPVTLQLSFTAEYDSGTGSNIVVTRSVT